jgi:hypothetical protein
MRVNLPSRRVYWDACTFLGLLNREANKLDACSAVWQEAEEGRTIIVTSFLSFVEVFNAKRDGKSKPLPQSSIDKVKALLEQRWVLPVVLDVDSFSGALGDLPKKLHGDDEAVLACLREHPTFSCWDVGTGKLATTIDRLGFTGRLRHVKDDGYPWCRVKVLPAPTSCVECDGRGSRHLVGRHYLNCVPCQGRGWIPAPPEGGPDAR